MSLQENFQKAQNDIKTLASLEPKYLLQLYALYKQATVGDVSGKKPGALDFKGKAKFEAWSEKKGMSSDEAKQAYVDLVHELLGE